MKLESKACCNRLREAVEDRVKCRASSGLIMSEVNENVGNKINSQGRI